MVPVDSYHMFMSYDMNLDTTQMCRLDQMKPVFPKGALGPCTFWYNRYTYLLEDTLLSVENF